MCIYIYIYRERETYIYIYIYTCCLSDVFARRAPTNQQKQMFTLLDLCVSSLRRGHVNLLCIVPILTDDPRRESLFV